MRLRIATWNVNSVRLRAEQVVRFIDEQAPDVLCLQEIKCQDAEFPREAFEAAGFPHLKIAGQKGWHGVAIASRLPIEDPEPLDVCREGHARCVGVKVAGVEIQNFYIPAGGDVPDPDANAKFNRRFRYVEQRAEEEGDPEAGGRRIGPELPTCDKPDRAHAAAAVLDGAGQGAAVGSGAGSAAGSAAGSGSA